MISWSSFISGLAILGLVSMSVAAGVVLEHWLERRRVQILITDALIEEATREGVNVDRLIRDILSEADS